MPPSDGPKAFPEAWIKGAIPGQLLPAYGRLHVRWTLVGLFEHHVLLRPSTTLTIGPSDINTRQSKLIAYAGAYIDRLRAAQLSSGHKQHASATRHLREHTRLHRSVSTVLLLGNGHDVL